MKCSVGIVLIIFKFLHLYICIFVCLVLIFFNISKPHISFSSEFYVAHKRRSTDSRALNLRNVRSGCTLGLFVGEGIGKKIGSTSAV